jgi:hypothetical protein
LSRAACSEARSGSFDMALCGPCGASLAQQLAAARQCVILGAPLHLNRLLARQRCAPMRHRPECPLHAPQVFRSRATVSSRALAHMWLDPAQLRQVCRAHARMRLTRARPRQVCRRPERTARLLHLQQHDHVRALPRALLLARQPLRPWLPAQLALGPPPLALWVWVGVLAEAGCLPDTPGCADGRARTQSLSFPLLQCPVSSPVTWDVGRGLQQAWARACAACAWPQWSSPLRSLQAWWAERAAASRPCRRQAVYGARAGAQVFCVPVAPRLPEPLLMPPKVWRALSLARLCAAVVFAVGMCLVSLLSSGDCESVT